MTEKELNEVCELKIKIEYLESKLKLTRDLLTKLTASYSGMPKANSFCESATERIVAQIVDLEKEIEELKISLPDKMARLEEKITSIVTKPKEQTILVLCYVYCMKFKEIGAAMNYSEKHIRRLYKSALAKLLEGGEIF